MRVSPADGRRTFAPESCCSLPLERLIGVRPINEAPAGARPLEQHVVIVGFGLAGRFAARSLAACSVPYVVLELNSETVRNARAQGLPVYYGDATSEEALNTRTFSGRVRCAADE